jgi:hypothetical protein
MGCLAVSLMKHPTGGLLQVLKRIDQVAVAQFIAFKDKPQTPEEKKARADLKEQKSALFSALHMKCKCAAPHTWPHDACRVQHPTNGATHDAHCLQQGNVPQCHPMLVQGGQVAHATPCWPMPLHAGLHSVARLMPGFVHACTARWCSRVLCDSAVV